MQKWEYATLSYADSRYHLATCGVAGGPVNTLKPDKSKGERTDGDVKRRAMAQLGCDGWEMVGCDSSSPYNETLYFKRPLL